MIFRQAEERQSKATLKSTAHSHPAWGHRKAVCSGIDGRHGQPPPPHSHEGSPIKDASLQPYRDGAAMVGPGGRSGGGGIHQVLSPSSHKKMERCWEKDNDHREWEVGVDFASVHLMPIIVLSCSYMVWEQ